MQQFRLIDLTGATRRFSQNCCIKEYNTELSKESKRWSDFVQYILNKRSYELMVTGDLVDYGTIGEMCCGVQIWPEMQVSIIR